MLKLLSYQPVSLYKNGGASRVLRRLYQGRESQVFSIGITGDLDKIAIGEIREQIIAAGPLHRPWMRWKVRNLFIWLRQKALRYQTINKVRAAAAAIDYDIIHLVHHGPYAMAVATDELLNGKQLWVSFHDHFSTAGTTFEDTRQLWKKADRRLVISTDMGTEYQHLFGELPFEIITDGILEIELSAPKIINPAEPFTIYFSGLLHNEYHPLFNILADALDQLTDTGLSFRIIMRGTGDVPFLNSRKFTVDYRTDFISDDAVKQEMDMAAILYLPIKFNHPEFYLYSMSTKMVGYLGAPGSILYHGPADSAACKMLQSANAAVNCTTLSVEDMMAAISALLQNNGEVSKNAKELARREFSMETIRHKFWQIPTA